jgi:hypothetical protein
MAPSFSSSQGQSPGKVANIARVLTLGALYCIASAGLIHYNKFLIDPFRFPHPLAIVLIHTVFSSCLSGVLFITRPSLFPSLTDSSSEVKLDWSLFLTGALPISVCFAGQLALSNYAYLHSSVAFLQMLKESNIVLVYVFSLCLAIEKLSWRNVGLLACVLAATCLTIQGELNFSMQGFTLQFTSQFFESTKIVLQSLLLSHAGRKLDALTYVLLVMPLCGVVLGVATAVTAVVHPELTLLPPGV